MYIYIDDSHCHTHALELHYLQYTVAGSQWQTLGHDSSLTLTYLPPHTIQVAAMGALSHKAIIMDGYTVLVPGPPFLLCMAPAQD